MRPPFLKSTQAGSHLAVLYAREIRARNLGTYLKLAVSGV